MASILVVDDDPAILEYVRRALRLAGYDVRAAVDGLEGLGFIEQAMPDLVVADINMDTLDGVGMLTDLRQYPHTKDLRLLMMTASQELHLREQVRELGALEILLKPFSPHELLAAVGRSLLAGA